MADDESVVRPSGEGRTVGAGSSPGESMWTHGTSRVVHEQRRVETNG